MHDLHRTEFIVITVLFYKKRSNIIALILTAIKVVDTWEIYKTA